jgi:diaminohydroxyphosphoribosylaminopyrimidine deaminase / 5-amino-6-(5-phosphoribosylamino)uracil reductase
MSWSEFDKNCMRRALELATHGQGHVEPNPMVGCVIATENRVIAEGYHEHFGEAHAEINALHQAGRQAVGATLYVTLEPCCHHGKTGPCSEAIVKAGVKRVVVAMRDPFPKVAGGGLAQIREAGIEIDLGLLEFESRRLNGPYLKLLQTGRPWVIAKWAMTACGRIATRTGSSRWISSPASRKLVHQLRSRVDLIGVGRRTAEMDDPLLTVRDVVPARTPVRLVVDSNAQISPESQLIQTARETPLIVAVGPQADPTHLDRLTKAGAEIVVCEGSDSSERLENLLDQLGQRRATNLLFEGGGALLGSFFDIGQIDEVHLFVAPKLIGGTNSPGPIGGLGLENMTDALEIDRPVIQTSGSDIYMHGTLKKSIATFCRP